MRKVISAKDQIKKTKKEATKSNIGIVTQVIGAVVDVHFDDELPSISHALKLKIFENKIETPHLENIEVPEENVSCKLCSI